MDFVIWFVSRKVGARNKRDFYVNLVDWVWEYLVPIALIHERDAEAAFNGLLKLRLALKQKMPLWESFQFLMNGVISNKFKKKSRKSRFNQSIRKPWCDIRVCGQCRFAEESEISALTLLQVCFSNTSPYGVFEAFGCDSRQWNGSMRL